MTGYQEVLTDPSYTGQIVTMTYPLIGNYGTTSEDQESRGIQVAGFIVRELTREPSNFRSQSDLELPQGGQHYWYRRDRHPRSCAPAGSGRDERRGLDHRSRRCVPREEGQGLPEHGRLDLVSKVVPKESFEWDRRPGAFAEHVRLRVRPRSASSPSTTA